MSHYKDLLKQLLPVLLSTSLVVASNVHADPGATIVTQGTATLESPPDRVRVQVGVLTTAPQADAAVAANSDVMARVVKAIQRLGVKTADLETRTIQVQPVWSNRSNTREREITGFQVRNQVEVTTGNLTLAGPILQEATRAGANMAGNLVFDLADPAPLRLRALALATQNAMTDARTLAAAAGVALGAVRTLSSAGAPAINPVHLRMESAASFRDAASAPPVSPGSVSVSANVHLTMDIAP